MTKLSERNNISIVISAYNEEGNIIPLYEEIKKFIGPIEGLNYELIFVNDGSKDKTLDKLYELVKKDKCVKIVNFVRNFGHEIAMTAGMDYAQGNGVIFMDADLQHPPSVLPSLISEWQKGYDIVLTKRTDNLEQSFFQKLKGKLFYKILNSISDTYIPPQNPDFRLIDKKYVEVVKKMKENNRMFRGLISWIGCTNQTVIPFKAPTRFSGSTKYNARKLLKLAIDSVVSFSIKPLKIATYIGLTTALISVLLGIFFVIQFISSETYEYTGFGTTIVMVIFLGSIQLIFLGIIGEYLGRVHMEIKNRPLYVADYITNIDEQEDEENKKEN